MDETLTLISMYALPTAPDSHFFTTIMSPTIEQQSGSPNITINQNNIIVLEIDNLLSNWPTYVLNYIPEQPGPLIQFPLIYYETDTDDRLQKIILRLKDVSKRAIEDHDETIESDLEDTKDAPAMVTKQWVKGASITLQLHSW